PISTSSTTDDGGGGGGGFSITSEEEENEDPTADAGGDLTAFVGEEIVLQGSGSDPDGSIIQYRWDFENDGEWDYVSEDSGTATAVYDRTGVYTAVFQVEDDENALSNDTARIEVFESTGNLEGIKSNFTASNDTLINYQYNSKSKTTSIEFTEENNFDTTKILELNLTLSEELEEHLSEFTITPSPEKIQERPRENSTANSTVITWRMDMEPNSSRTINISSDNYISRKTWEGIELSRDWEDSKTTTPTGFITRNRMGIIGVLLALFIALVVYVFWKREQEKLKKEEPYDKQVWEAVERLKRKIREEKY
ncbi:MAG: PKD domain-containing protein, partial [Candidatus Nanohaloarchaeota archaeon QJJ-9]|nr:PKD domain-containing protein [Candidatus Nanohaloarchaeota archaeon QJJ-9]